MESNTPEWSKLPQDPLGFFELTSADELNTLKRRYHSYIKRFKPEKFPDEFRRIREAFDLAKAKLTENPGAPIDSSDFLFSNAQPISAAGADPADQAIQDADSEVGGATIPRYRNGLCEWICSQIQERGAVSLIAALRAIVKKSPDQYFALAILGDIELSERESHFTVRLLEGVAAHPYHVGLRELSNAAYNFDHRWQRHREILTLASEQIEGEPFFFATFPCWMTLSTRPITEQTSLASATRLFERGPNCILQIRLTLFFVRTWMWIATEEDMEKPFRLLERCGNLIQAFGGADPQFLRSVFVNRQHIDENADEYSFDLTCMIVQCVKHAWNNVDDVVFAFMREAALDEDFCLRSFQRSRADCEGLWRLTEPFLEQMGMRRGLFDSREPLTPSETLVDRIVNEPRTKKAFIRERLSPTYQMAKRDLSKLGAASILILVFVGFAVFASLSFSKEDAETSRRFCSAGIFGAVVLALGGTQMEKPYAYFRELWFVGNCLRKNRTPVLRDAKDYRRLRPRVFDAIRGRIVDMVEVVELLRAREEKKDDKSGLLADMIEEDLALQLFALAQPFEILGNVRFN